MIGPRTRSVLLALAMLVATAHPAIGDAGDLDTSFSGDGKAVADFGTGGEWGEAVAVRADGRVLVAGTRYPTGAGRWRFAIAQFRPDGTLDPDFGGGDGQVSTAFAGLDADAQGVVLLPSGKFLVAGHAGGHVLLARYQPDGRLDASFDPEGVAGTLILPRQGDLDVVRAVSLFGSQPVIVGTSHVASAGPRVMVMRLTPSGELDTTFGLPAEEGRTGVALFRVNGSTEAEDAVVLDDGSIVVAGSTSGSTELLSRWLVVKFTPAGKRDPSFGGGDGWLTTQFGSRDTSTIAYGIAAAPDGRLIVAGDHTGEGGFPNNMTVARYTASGALDPTFGTGGKAVYDEDGISEGAADVAVAPGGKIVMVGRRSVGDAHLVVARATSSGMLDPTFGNRGMRMVDVRRSHEIERGRGVAVRDGKIVVVGNGDDIDGEPQAPSIFTVVRLRNS